MTAYNDTAQRQARAKRAYKEFNVMTKIEINQRLTFEEAEKVAKSQGYETVIMVTAKEDVTTVYVA